MNIPVYTLAPGREKTARTFHPWIFSGALASETPKKHIDLRKTTESNDPVNRQEPLPSLARIEDHKGVFVAWGQVNPDSKIRIRLCSWNEKNLPGREWLKTTLASSIGRRAQIAAGGGTTAMRLVFAESDELPGVVIDRLGDWLLVQLETAGADSWRSELASLLPEVACAEIPGLRGILERSDGDGRAIEGLPGHRQLWWGEEPPARIEIAEYGIAFGASPGGQKTGFYADQRENRLIAAGYARGARVLDVCCYTGGFAAHAAAAGAAALHLIDASQEALHLAETNVRHALAASGSPENAAAPVETSCGDAFKLLRELQGKKRFDMIVLDPPKLAPKRADVPRALAAYKDLNLQAMRLLETGGILVSFSCSALVSADDLRQAIAYAAKDLNKRFQILHRLYQAPDHPVTLGFPDAEYLKGFLLRLL